MKADHKQTDEFIQLIKEQEKLVYKICHVYAAQPEDRKDLFQEIVIQAWTAYPRFSKQSKASTWLYRVALNTAINHKRKNTRHPATTGMDWLHDQYAEPAMAADNKYKLMHELISSLPPMEKALVLLYLEDSSHHEIAEIMGISVSNVGTRIMRIKEKLKKQAQQFVNN